MIWPFSLLFKKPDPRKTQKTPQRGPRNNSPGITPPIRTSQSRYTAEQRRRREDDDYIAAASAVDPLSAHLWAGNDDHSPHRQEATPDRGHDDGGWTNHSHNHQHHYDHSPSQHHHVDHSPSHTSYDHSSSDTGGGGSDGGGGSCD